MINNLCTFLKHSGEKNAAMSLLRALNRHSTTFEQFEEIAKTAFDIKDYELSVEVLEKMIKGVRDPKVKYDLETNLTNAYSHANQPEKALDLIDKHEKIIPNDRDRELKKAYALFLMYKFDEAEALLRKNLENPYITDKVKLEINFNLGTYDLYKDNFQEGLYRFLVYGRQIKNEQPQLPYKKWNGEDITGKNLIILAEAGIGDEFINIRFMKHLKDRGIKAYWKTDKEGLNEIFEYNGYNIFNKNDRLIDPYWCYSMDLPILLNLKYEDLWYGPYLQHKPTNVPDVFDTNKLKIGLRWQGNIHYDNDLHRSLNLKSLIDVVKTSEIDAELYSIQRDDGVEELVGMTNIMPLHDKSLTTFNETLNIINELDVVITSCTSIAHAAAAMGKRTIIFVPISAYYTWCNTWKEKSPWYGDNITVLRQTTPRSWDEPLNRLKELLVSEFYTSHQY